MVTGQELSAATVHVPLKVNYEVIECIHEFPYLVQCMVVSSQTVDTDVEKRIALPSRAFGALRSEVLKYRRPTKHTVYQACVLSVLMHSLGQ